MSVDEYWYRMGVKHDRKECPVCQDMLTPFDKQMLEAALSFEGNFCNNRPEKFLAKVHKALKENGWKQ